MDDVLILLVLILHAWACIQRYKTRQKHLGIHERKHLFSMLLWMPKTILNFNSFGIIVVNFFSGVSFLCDQCIIFCRYLLLPYQDNRILLGLKIYWTISSILFLLCKPLRNRFSVDHSPNSHGVFPHQSFR